jgi:bis(5'-nucleosidyl)-tetraphosphatase
MAAPAQRELALSAGIVPIRRTRSGPLVLLLRVYNYWDFPKGLRMPGEEPLTTALRELREETGIEAVDFPWGQEFIETEPYSYGKVARYYVAETRAADVVLGVNPMIGHAEHHEFRWVTADEARALLGPRVRRVLGWALGRMRSRGTTTQLRPVRS